jgi:hypothetical protein
VKKIAHAKLAEIAKRRAQKLNLPRLTVAQPLWVCSKQVVAALFPVLPESLVPGVSFQGEQQCFSETVAVT